MYRAIISVLLALFSLFSHFGAAREARAPEPGGERVAYGEQAANNMDVYYPDDVGSAADVVFLIHGGSWLGGDQTMFFDHAVEAAAQGYIGVTVDYSKLSDRATALTMNDELLQACGVLKETLLAKGITPRKMVVVGHSAGAHLALLYAYTHYADSPIDIAFVTACSSPSEFLTLDKGKTVMERNRYLLCSALSGEEISRLTLHCSEKANAAMDAITPYALANADVPPTLLVHGDADDWVPYGNSTRLFEKLQSLDVPCELITLEGANHFLGHEPGAQETIEERMLAWAELYL